MGAVLRVLGVLRDMVRVQHICGKGVRLVVVVRCRIGLRLVVGLLLHVLLLRLLLCLLLSVLLLSVLLLLKAA